MDKLKAAIHYIVSKGPIDSDKLNEILFRADCMAYLETGKSITGQTYIKE